jgi:hypothetical protein
LGSEEILNDENKGKRVIMQISGRYFEDFLIMKIGIIKIVVNNC